MGFSFSNVILYSSQYFIRANLFSLIWIVRTIRPPFPDIFPNFTVLTCMFGLNNIHINFIYIHLKLILINLNIIFYHLNLNYIN